MTQDNPEPVRAAVCGATGRMGARLCAMIEASDRFQLAARFSDPDEESSAPSRDRSSAIECDVLIDFSTDAGANRAATIARERNAALLVGTTGLSAQTLENLEVCAHHVPVMIAPNTSRGVAVITHLAGETARLLGPKYDIEMIDIHHRHKRDAPSGTALKIEQAMREANPQHHLSHDRIHSLRCGDVVGEHQIHFAGPGEKILLIHAATSRDVFVSGALDAAEWLVRQPPGRYTIEQSLGLS
jgi:4-hydroxy-tetrahydrodipicolinate reductase